MHNGSAAVELNTLYNEADLTAHKYEIKIHSRNNNSIGKVCTSAKAHQILILTCAFFPA